MKIFYVVALTFCCAHLLAAQTPPGALKLINQTIAFIENRTIQGPSSFLNQLQAIKQKEKVIAGFSIKTMDNELIYSLTSASRRDGLNAIGLALDHKNPAYSALLAGKPYRAFTCSNRVDIFGKRYFADYEPFIQKFPTDAAARLYGMAFAASPCSLQQSKPALVRTLKLINEFIISLTLELYKRLATQGVLSAIFVKTGKDFLYALDTIPTTPNTRVVGTFLERSNPAYKPALQGREFVGPVTLFGKNYFGKYKPYTIDGRVAGLFFAGVATST